MKQALVWDKSFNVSKLKKKMKKISGIFFIEINSFI